jgi:SAM-dependent methyltransferase
MLDWFDDSEVLKDVMTALADHDVQVTRDLASRESVGGYCTACRQPTVFSVTAGGEKPDEWRNLLEGMLCLCGTNGRTRLALNAWRQLHQSQRSSRSLIFERVTQFYGMLASEDPALEGCEYLGPDKIPGECYDVGDLRIRHEDIMALSCADQSLDLIMHFDVIEHVPDHRQAFRECFRVLRPGGYMLFTLPFYEGLDRHLVRAHASEQGIRHILEPAYHGNPVGDGALVFFHPGWQLLEDLAEAGFLTQIGFDYQPAAGIVSNGCPYPDGHMWPVIFKACRPVAS